MLKKLGSFLSFKPVGIEWTPAVQAGRWSGITYLLSKNGQFNLGLLHRVKEWLTQRKYDFVVEDKRPSIPPSHPLDVSANFANLKMVPREHQVRMVNAALSNEKGIIRATTGSGKSIAIASLVAELNKPTIIYVIGLDLLQQFYSLFSKVFDEKIGFVGNGIVDPARITIASIWTIGRALKMEGKTIFEAENETMKEEDINESGRDKILGLLKEAKVHILDECHVATCATIETIHKNIDPERIYGFSGTPFSDRGDELLLHAIFGEQIINISASEMIEKGIIARPIIKFLTVPKMQIDNNSSYLTIYKEYIVENEIRNNMIVSSVSDLLSRGYTPLVLFRQIKHGNLLFQKMLDAGITCDLLNGNDPLEKRDEIKAKLISGEIKAIVASTIFDIGLNLEQLSALVMCGGNKSPIKSLQRVGRVLRMLPGKTHAAVVDFYDQAKYLKSHSKIRCETYQTEPGFKVIRSPEMIK